MKLLLIEGSSKLRRSASATLLDALRPSLSGAQITDAALKKPALPPELLPLWHSADAVVLAFPLYVDGIPSHLLHCLTALEEPLRCAGQKPPLYALMNCGFYEGVQCTPAMEMLRQFCRRAEIPFGGGLGVGAGGALTGLEAVPLGTGPKKTLAANLAALAGRILSLQTAPPVYMSLDLSWTAYQEIGESGWRKAAQKRGLCEADLSRPCPPPEV